MIYGLERAFSKAENDSIAVVKLLIEGKTIDEIETAINVTLQEVLHIKKNLNPINLRKSSWVIFGTICLRYFYFESNHFFFKRTGGFILIDPPVKR